MKNITEEQILKTREIAHNYFNKEGFLCSESVLKAVLEAYNYTDVDKILNMATGMGGGIGGSGCICGTITGGVMAGGLIAGRGKAGIVSSQLHKKFIERNRTTCCRVLTKGMDKKASEHKEQCARFTAETTEDLMRLLSEIL